MPGQAPSVICSPRCFSTLRPAPRSSPAAAAGPKGHRTTTIPVPTGRQRQPLVVRPAPGHHADHEPEHVRVAAVASCAVERVRPNLPDTPARRLRDAAEVIATLSWWGKPVNDRMAALWPGFRLCLRLGAG